MKKSNTLTEKQILKKLGVLSGWQPNKKQTEISKTFPTPSFIAGLSLIARIAVHAELLNHHPKIELSYSKLKIILTTHDENGLTAKDFELAERIERLMK